MARFETWRWLGAIVAVVVALGVAVAPREAVASDVVASGWETPAATGAAFPTLTGMGGGSFREAVPAIEDATGRVPALWQLYWTLELDWPNAWAPAMLDELDAMGVVPFIELTTDDLPALVRGDKDDEIEAMLDAIAPWAARSGKQLLIAPLPEANLDEHAYGGDPARYRAAYRKLRDRFLARGLGPDDVRFVFWVNGISSPGHSYPPYYPGDGSVDIIAFSKINRGAPWRDYATTFQMHIDELRRDISRSKPILVAQTASVDGGSGREAWIGDMTAGLAAHEQVLGAVWFNKDAGSYDLRVLVGDRLSAAYARQVRSWSAPTASRWIFGSDLDDWVRSRDGVPAARFGDAATSPFLDDIVWVANQGITTGCADDRYCPGAYVTRGQMASFLVRALDLPPGDGDTFTDDDRSPHEASIEAVVAAGITEGCGGTRFCPDTPISRGQMATFLAKALDLPATSTDHFDDDDGTRHEANIDRVAEAGITGGCRTRVYCHSSGVTRQQMAAFLHRADGA